MDAQLYPLTIGQRLVLHSERTYPGTPVHNVSGLLLIEDELDFGLLEEAIRLLVRRNDALRLRLVLQMKNGGFGKFYSSLLYKDVFMQYVQEDPPVSVRFLDFSGRTREELDAELIRINSTPIDVTGEPVYDFTMVKAGDGRQGVFSKLHHICTDGWMSSMYARQIMDLYYALKNGEELPPAPHSFLTVIEAEKAYLQSPQYQADKEFWLSKLLTGRPHNTYISGGKRFPKTRTGKSDRYEVRMDRGLSEAVGAFCRDNEISQPVLYNQLMGIRLARVSGYPDVSFTTPSMLRATLKEKRTCGPMVNFTLVRMRIDDNKTFVESCRELHAEHLSGMRHIRFPMAHAMIPMHKKYLLLAPPYDVLIAFQVALIQTKENVRFESKWYPSGYYPNPFTLNITDMDGTGTYLFQYEYWAENYSAKLVEDTHQSLMDMLGKVLHDPSISVRNL
jgi:hypothetical protein